MRSERALLLAEYERRRSTARSYIPHEPHPKQREFLTFTGLEALYGGAAGGGKSDALLMAALQYVHVPGYAAILFRRTYSDLSLPGALMDRARQWLGGTNARWNDKTKTWHFPSTATVSFGYLDNANDHYRYQGAEFQFEGFDELTQFLESQYRYLFSRLRKRKGVDVPLRIRNATNPGGVGHDWVKARYIDTPQDRLFVPARLEDNPSVDRESYESSLAQLDPVTRQQLREGLWVRDTSGLVYKLGDANVIDKLPDLPGGEEWSNVLGIDYGNVDATALSVLCFSKHSPNVYVRKSQAWTNLTPSDAAIITDKWRKHYDFERIVGDVGGLGKGYAEEARRRFAIPIRPAKKLDKIGYIKLLNGALANGELFVVRAHNEELIGEMRALLWQDDFQKAEHPKMKNHLCDATLYAWREARGYQYEDRVVPPAPGTKEFYDALEADIDWDEERDDP